MGPMAAIGPSCPSSGQTPEMMSPSSTCAGEGLEPSVAWCRCRHPSGHLAKGTSFPMVTGHGVTGQWYGRNVASDLEMKQS